ncbi:hypothetical protein PAXRUDRAFT_78862, partial [Paxillus rubicundulus Ve08.2h10]
MAEVPDLTTDGQNWMTYRIKLLQVAADEKLDKYLDGTATRPINATKDEVKTWQRQDAMAKWLITCTVPDSILVRLGLQAISENNAHYFFTELSNLFEESTAT